eukprot:85893-Pleurochrysis_carterae.AAC.2
MSGLSDLLPMDHSQWGGIIYVCPIFDPVIAAMWALGLVCSLLAATVSTYGLVLRVKAAHAQELWAFNERPTRILALLLWSAICAIGLCVCKLYDPTLLIGIDFAPSLFFWGGLSGDFFTGAEHITHVLAKALSAQLSTYGQTYIDEAVAKEAWQLYLHASVASLVYAVPLVGAALSTSGHHDAAVQTSILLITNLGSVIVVSLGVLRFWLRSKSLQATFARSIVTLEVRLRLFAHAPYAAIPLAAEYGLLRPSSPPQAQIGKLTDLHCLWCQASLTVASGGCSQAMATCRRASATIEGGAKPVYLQTLEDEISMLQRTARRFKWHARQVSAEMLGTRLVICAFCAVPFLWNKVSYIFAFNTCLDRLCLTLEIAATYIPKRRDEAAHSIFGLRAICDRLTSRGTAIAV